jgi:hypothetical protein
MPAHEPGASPVLVLTPEGGPVITGAASDTAVYDPVDTLCATHPAGAVGLSSTTTRWSASCSRRLGTGGDDLGAHVRSGRWRSR